ncbi:unnamed protein product [Discosporangium mesarthrocarpum]
MTATLKISQAVQRAYAARSAKQCGSRMSRATKNQLATRAYVDVAVPGLMKWLSLEEPDLTPPAQQDLMLQTTMGTRKEAETLLSCSLNLCHQHGRPGPAHNRPSLTNISPTGSGSRKKVAIWGTLIGVVGPGLLDPSSSPANALLQTGSMEESVPGVWESPLPQLPCGAMSGKTHAEGLGPPVSTILCEIWAYIRLFAEGLRPQRE